MTTFALPDLLYGYDALQPTISNDIMTLHHDKHHQTYVTFVNKWLADNGGEAADLESLVRSSKADAAQAKLFNNAGQAWNHGFFWNAMAPGGGEPSGAVAQAVEAFGGLEALKAKFVEGGVGQFGSGWVWIQASPSGELSIVQTANGDTALLRDGKPITGCDVWEHAYYLDYKQDRKGYLEAWFDGVLNWEFAGRQFDAATGSAEGYTYPKPS